ncbi:putative inverse autotransporter beta-barrel domain-containing protein [Dickeya phage vB_DsoM_AD1]|uniref:Putative inverse autotransporter beta-barrel domain-containing protein n=1 Tax=Dickeya phage vB_DsoM_AD1 TaxID=2283029 RepID=A0A384ZYE3_9CAUD|nr:putative inverse autotransporter beta-barrel domain-containing protein [Dickeya phage vB_DsoM_AD1]AXG67264.1 putative inverse autotransporter beta-barrel domain-containing protein [Dickeya phage vB_DsoM_AD1]
MSNFISLDQYRAFIQRNILSEPQMLVSNQTQPLGQISFQCPGDNFQMKDVIIPATRNAVDLTQQAPLENLLACSQLKSLIQLQRIALLNPDDMPQPGEGIPQPSLSQTPVAGAVSVDGTTIPNAVVIVEQNGNVWTGTSNGSGVFTVDVSGLEEGPFSITVTANGYTPARYDFEAGPQPLQPMPEPVVHAVFKETTVSGTTVANANIVVSVQSKQFTGQADDTGAFSINVDPLPADTIHLTFTADGYLDKTVDHVVDTVAGLAQINSAAFLSTSLAGKANPNGEVEILIDGQANQFATADAQGDWTATVGAVKGAVSIRALAVDGYDEATATMQPTKLQFGAIAVDDADAFGETRTVVSGTIAGLNAEANDIAVTVTVQAGVYEGTVNLAAGTFNITGVDAKAGVGSTGVVNVTSAFYEDGSTSFTILEEFAAPTLQQAQDGQTAVVGDTVASTTVKITMNGETKTASSNAQGAFSVDGFTNVVPGPITIELSRAQYLPASFQVTLVVEALGQLDADLKAGEDTVAGQATPGSTVTLTQGSVTGDAVADSSTGEFIITLSGPLVEGQAQLVVQHAGYVDFTDTLAVAAA